MNAELWQPNLPGRSSAWPHAPMLMAISRRLSGRCPARAKPHLFNGFLRVMAECLIRGAPFNLERAVDAPRYFTILVTGQVIVPMIYRVDRMNEPPIWLMSAIFLPLPLVMALGLWRPIKRGTIGLTLNLNMLKSDAKET